MCCESTQALWFAHNSLPLRWQRQPHSWAWQRDICCDLLKIHYLCGDKYNSPRRDFVSPLVVICSKFITFAVTNTTEHEQGWYVLPLWFAQNSLPLRWQIQHPVFLRERRVSCDLLKIHYLCGDKYNYCVQRKKCRRVVICSKFITFAVTNTTNA